MSALLQREMQNVTFIEASKKKLDLIVIEVGLINTDDYAGINYAGIRICNL